MSAADAWIATGALVLSGYKQPQRLPPFGQPPTRFRCRLDRQHSEADRGRRFACPDSYASNLSHLDAMGVVHEPVEDAVGQRWIASLFVPVLADSVF
jgi:hypothetical protein